MTAKRFQQIENAFDAVLRAPEAERIGVIAHECGDDSEMRAHVESLLAYHSSVEDLSDGRPLPQLLLRALTEPRLSPGDAIGAYEVVGRIGFGGMGEVYEARDRRLDRRVAIKLLSPGSAHDPEMVRRFEREARLASSLNHPNILTVYDVGDYEGSRYLVTELVQGENLRQRMMRGPLDLTEIVRIVRQAASGLQAAHEAGIIHRDVKPENIMIRRDDVVRVVDFGLARPFSAGQDTASVAIAGTLPYMSPEQLRGSTLDARSDLWSLGVVLQDIGGRKPELRPVIAKLLAHSAEDRYQSAADLILDLDALCTTAPSRRWRRIWSGAAVIGLLVTAGVVSLRIRSPAPIDVQLSPLTASGKAGFAAISGEGRFVAYTERSQNRQSLLLRQVNEGSTAVLVPPKAVRYGGVAFSPASDAVYFSYAEKTSYRTLFRVPIVGGESSVVLEDVDSPLGFSRDGKRMAFIRSDTGLSWLITATVNGDELRKLVERRGDLRFREAAPAWSPDGRLIAAAAWVKPVRPKESRAALLLFDSSTGEEVRALGRRWVDVSRIAWSQDDSLYITASADPDSSSQVYRVAYPEGRDERLTIDPSRYHDLTAQADGRALGAIRTERLTHVTVVTRGGTEPPRRVTVGSAQYRSIDAMSDGNFLVVSNASGTFEVWVVHSDPPTLRRITRGAGAKTSASACPNGIIVYSEEHGAGCNIWRVTRDGRDATALTSGDYCDTGPRCSPDSSTVLFQSNRSGLLSAWAVPAEGGVPRLLTPASICRDPVWSPDGGSFACAYSANAQAAWTTAIFSAAGGAQPVRRIDGIPKDAVVRWDPTGKALLYPAQHEGWNALFRTRLDAAGRPVPIIKFSEELLDFVPLSDGRFAAIQGTTVQDAILLRLSGRGKEVTK